MLARILARKKEEVAGRKAQFAPADLVRQAAASPPTRPFGQAVRRPHRLSLIAEIKPASPVLGPLAVGVDAGVLARSYTQAGADAVSVLTDAAFFGASPENLRLARRHTECPLLHKEFIIDPYQLYLSRLWGADAVLLIVAALSDGLLSALLAEAASLGLSCLVEVHTERELERALAAGADLLAVNNRDLFTMEVDFETTFRLLPLIDLARVTLVSASGIGTTAQVRRLAASGVHAVLAGTALMAEPVRAVAELLGGAGYGQG